MSKAQYQPSGKTDDEADSLTVGQESCDVELFIPLLQLCAHQQLFQVI